MSAYLSVADAAARVSLSPKTIRVAINENRLAASRIGAKILISIEELDRFIRSDGAAAPVEVQPAVSA